MSLIPIPSLSNPVTDKFTESVYVLANEPSVALYRLQEHVRRSLPELAQHKVSSASPAKDLSPEQKWGTHVKGLKSKQRCW